MEPEKRLYRSKNDRMLCGVCAGVAEYFHIDPTWKSLSSKETGRIGGMVNRKKREKKEEK